MNSHSADPTRTLIVPDLGSVQEPITFVGWLVDEGDLVMEGERVAELLVEGVLVQLSAPGSGRFCPVSISSQSPLCPGQKLAEIVHDDDLPG